MEWPEDHTRAEEGIPLCKLRIYDAKGGQEGRIKDVEENQSRKGKRRREAPD